MCKSEEEGQEGQQGHQSCHPSFHAISNVIKLCQYIQSLSRSGSNGRTAINASDQCQGKSAFKFLLSHREFGKASVVKHSFQQQWFQSCHGCTTMRTKQDLAFCFACVNAYKNNQRHSTPCLLFKLDRCNYCVCQP